MKNKTGLLLMIVCILTLSLTQAVFAQNLSDIPVKLPCICLDENGLKYPDTALNTVLCYTCTEENGCVWNGLTKEKCYLLNLSLTPTPIPETPKTKPTEAPVVNTYTEPVYEAPVTNTYTEPVYEAPVTNTYTEPVYEAPVTNTYTEPVYEAPVTNTYTEPVYEAPVVNTYTEPVYEAPVTNTYTEPVYEAPVVNTYTEPVYEAPVTNTYTEPVYEAPVTNTYTEPVYENPFVNTYTEPVYEVPAANTYTEPLYEAPVADTYTEPVYENPFVNTFTEPVYEVPITNVYTEPVYEEPATDTFFLSGFNDQDTDLFLSQDFGEPDTNILPGTGSDGPDTDPVIVPNFGEPDTNILPGFGSDGPDTDPVIVPDFGEPDTNILPGPGSDGPDTDPVIVPDFGEPDTNILPGTGSDRPDTDPVIVPDFGKPDADILPGPGSEEPDTDPVIVPDFGKPDADILPGPGSDGPDTDPVLDPDFGKPDTDILPGSGSEEPDTDPIVTPETTPEPDLIPNKDLPTEEADKPVLRKGVSIEGKLDKLGLSSPDGETYTSPAVTFTWVYLVTGDSSTEVDFTLALAIEDKESGLTTNSSTHLEDAAVCQDFICQYTAGNELSGFKQADVTWTVSGTFMDGETPVTVYPENPIEKYFSLDVTETTETPTPTTTPSATPTTTPVPKPKAPVLECPKGTYRTRSLGFYWAPSANAETYTVTWKNDRNQSGTLKLKDSDTTCQKGRCIVYGTMPSTGQYVWYVTAKNSSGSAKSKTMNFTIETNISTPAAYRPNGTIQNRYYPSFEWQDVQDGVTAYRIQVIGKYDNLLRMDNWYQVKDIYVGKGVCYVRTNLFLPAGTYSWRVQAKNDEFTSNWSAWRDFYVECDYCNSGPSAPATYTNTILSISYPTGTITTRTPDFQWRALTGAGYYQVKLYSSTGQLLFDNQVGAVANCTAELCTWKPGYKLPANGNYSWTVNGYGANGVLWGSTSAGFTLQAVVAMNPMSFRSPAQNGWLSLDSPRIIWTDPGETTALFGIEIYDKTGKQRFSAELNREQAWCDGLTCSIEFRTIPDAENYRIAVTQYSDLNTKGQTIELTFSKGSKPIRLISPKENSVNPARPMFRWALEAGASAQYELTIIDANNTMTVISPLVCGAEGVTCEDGEAFFSPSYPLQSGSYTASVTVLNGGYTGEALHFTVK